MTNPPKKLSDKNPELEKLGTEHARAMLIGVPGRDEHGKHIPKSKWPEAIEGWPVAKKHPKSDGQPGPVSTHVRQVKNTR